MELNKVTIRMIKIANRFSEKLGTTLCMYVPKVIALKAIGAANPIVELSHPDTNPMDG